MKIPLSVREAYAAQHEINTLLQKQVDIFFMKSKASRWHYESRVKEPESFAIKIESGRTPRPEALEDFFACTLVVANTAEIKDAKQLVRDNFDIKYQRPRSADKTAKSASAFPFDDLRLYVKRKNVGMLPPSPLDEIIFEVQIKTFLQHAWGIATHDLVYKTDEVRWSKDRIAAHIKAMIEHAELSIQEASTLANSDLLSKSDEPTRDLAAIISVLVTHWPRNDLPENIRGLAQALQSIMAALPMTPAELNDLLRAEKLAGSGSFDLNLSPYGIVVQGILRQRTNASKTMLADPNLKARLVIAREVQLPIGLDLAGLRNVVRVP